MPSCPHQPRRPSLAWPALALLLTLTACHSPRNSMAEWIPSPNFNARRPQMVVIHHTAEPSFAVSLRILQTQNSGGPVSSHYLIGRDGRLVQLVSDDHRAYHAGGGTWGPYRDLNSLSIGIELDNNGFEPFAEPQVATLLTLLEDLTKRFNIPRTQVLGHADVDPVRKQDPSAYFPWEQLAQRGFGLWPAEPMVEPTADFDPWLALRTIGYSMKDPAASVRAFHRHYRRMETTELDDQDRRLLFNLLARLTPEPRPR